jgi:phage regulator Rha-like protein
MVLMTKDGLVFLVMSFTGKEVARIKESYIGALHAMASRLQQIAVTGFRDLWAQRLELETRDANTFQWASFSAKRMLDRKRELPGTKDEPDPWQSREDARRSCRHKP